MPRRMKITVHWYKASSRVYGGVELGVLEPLGSREVIVAAKDPVDAILRAAEEEARSGKGDYIEVILDDGETRRVIGVAPKYTWSRPLFYRPERLVRVGIVRLEPRRGGEEDEGEAPEAASLEVPPEAIEWHIVDEELYVFEGKAQMVEGARPARLVIVETSSGSRILRPAPASLRRRISS